MKSFDAKKKDNIEKLGKPDKSRKGNVDEDAWPMIHAVNALGEYFTTSSCAGRITVFKESLSGKKHDAQWLYVTHELGDEEAIVLALKDSYEETLWLRMEPPIFHIACKDEEAASRLLKLCQRMGWKRSGIISVGGKRVERYMLEIVANERVDVPICEKHEVFFSEEYVRFVVRKANEKLRVVREKLEVLRLEIEREVKDW